MENEIKNQFGKEAYFMGVDLAYRLKWWQRLLVWLRLRKRTHYQDLSCSIVFKRIPDGTLEVVDVNYF